MVLGHWLTSWFLMVAGKEILPKLFAISSPARFSITWVWSLPIRHILPIRHMETDHHWWSASRPYRKSCVQVQTWSTTSKGLEGVGSQKYYGDAKYGIQGGSFVHNFRCRCDADWLINEPKRTWSKHHLKKGKYLLEHYLFFVHKKIFLLVRVRVKIS